MQRAEVDSASITVALHDGSGRGEGLSPMTYHVNAYVRSTTIP